MKSKFIPYYMAIAYETAKLSSAERAQVGAVIVKDNRIISIGYNGMPSGWSNQCEYIVDTKSHTKPEVLHAETNAIAKVAQSSESSKDAALFCTHEPCIECAKLIYQSGITAVYFKDTYEAAKGSGRDFLEKSGCLVEQLQ